MAEFSLNVTSMLGFKFNSNILITADNEEDYNSIYTLIKDSYGSISVVENQKEPKGDLEKTIDIDIKTIQNIDERLVFLYADPDFVENPISVEEAKNKLTLEQKASILKSLPNWISEYSLDSLDEDFNECLEFWLDKFNKK